MECSKEDSDDFVKAKTYIFEDARSSVVFEASRWIGRLHLARVISLLLGCPGSSSIRAPAVQYILCPSLLSFWPIEVGHVQISTRVPCQTSYSLPQTHHRCIFRPKKMVYFRHQSVRLIFGIVLLCSLLWLTSASFRQETLWLISRRTGKTPEHWRPNTCQEFLGNTRTRFRLLFSAVEQQTNLLFASMPLLNLRLSLVFQCGGQPAQSKWETEFSSWLRRRIKYTPLTSVMTPPIAVSLYQVCPFFLSLSVSQSYRDRGRRAENTVWWFPILGNRIVLIANQRCFRFYMWWNLRTSFLLRPAETSSLDKSGGSRNRPIS